MPLLVSSGVLRGSLPDLVLGVQILDVLHALLMLGFQRLNGLLGLLHTLAEVSDALLLILAHVLLLSACCWLCFSPPAVGQALLCLLLAMLSSFFSNEFGPLSTVVHVLVVLRPRAAFGNLALPPFFLSPLALLAVVLCLFSV